MSFAVPTTNHGLSPTLSPQQQQQLDAPLIALAQRCNGDLRVLFHSFFSFLNRRTDFYCVHNQLDIDQGNKVNLGFKNGDAEKLLLAAFKQFPLRRMPPSNATATTTNTTATKAKAKSPHTSSAVPSASNNTGNPPQSPDKKSDTTKRSNETVEPNIKSRGSVDADEGKHEDKGTKKSDNIEAVRYTEEEDQVPVGNGGSTERYKWTQTLDEITIAMPLPRTKDSQSGEVKPTRAKDLNVQIKPSSMAIEQKCKSNSDESDLLKGEFLDKIKTDESTWSIESNVLLITLEKCSKRWWNRVFQDEKETIDIDLVDKTHKISDYDEATQGMIRKILFDQRQERLGLPTSDKILDDKGNTKGDSIATSATVTKCNGEKLDVRNLPPGVEFIDKHNFPGGN